MTTDPDDTLPLFLSAGEPEKGIGNGRAVISLRFVIASILVATAAATGISILSAGNPVTPFADVSLADKSVPQRGTDQSTPIIQSVGIQVSADTEALPPPTRDISAPEPTSQTKTETDEASLEPLFKEFQAWNAEQDAQDLAKRVQDDPAPVAKDATASVRPMQKHRRAQTIRNARAEMIRHEGESRANVRRRNERVQARPLLYAREQIQSVQYAEPPSYLRELLPF
jgi:hypothetical protein